MKEIDWYYLGEHDEEEVLKRMKESEYYIGITTPSGENKLIKVPKGIYDSRMEIVKHDDEAKRKDIHIKVERPIDKP